MRGINETPIVLVLAIFTPELFVLIAYMCLCWLCFATYIDAHSEHLNKRDSDDKGTVVMRVVAGVLIILHVVLVTLYMADAVNAFIVLVVF